MIKLKGLDFTKSRNWLKKAQECLGDDPVAAFAFVWFSFNHYYSTFAIENKGNFDKYRGTKQGDKVELLYLVSSQEFQHFFDSYRECYPENLHITIELPVIDMLYFTRVPDVNEETRSLSELTNEDLFKVIYQIRNNLFHGNKDPEIVRRDQNLCEAAGHFMIPFFETLLKDTYGEVKTLSNNHEIIGAQDDIGLMKSDISHTSVSPETLEECLYKLDSEDSLDRVDALKQLGKIQHSESIDRMIVLLKDKDERVRLTAAWALGQTKNPVAIEFLIKALKDKSGYVQAQAATALGKFIDHSSVEALVEALENQNVSVRIAALQALLKIGIFDLGLLIKCLQDDNTFVKQIALFALGKMKYAPAIKLLIDELENEEIRNHEAEIEYEKALAEQEFEEEDSNSTVSYEDYTYNRELVREYFEYRDEYEEMEEEEKVPEQEYFNEEVDEEFESDEDENASDYENYEGLDGYQYDPDPGEDLYYLGRELHQIEHGHNPTEPLETPASVLKEIGAPAAEPLMSFISDTSKCARRQALEILGEINHPKVFGFVLDTFKDEELDHVALYVLGKMPDPRMVEPLMSFISDTSKCARRQALEILGEINHPKVFGFVLDTLKDEELRDVAIHVLGKMRDQRGIRPLLELVKVGNRNLDQNILNALLEIGVPAIPSLFESLFKLKFMESQFGAYEDDSPI